MSDSERNRKSGSMRNGRRKHWNNHIFIRVIFVSKFISSMPSRLTLTHRPSIPSDHQTLHAAFLVRFCRAAPLPGGAFPLIRFNANIETKLNYFVGIDGEAGGSSCGLYSLRFETEAGFKFMKHFSCPAAAERARMCARR